MALRKRRWYGAAVLSVLIGIVGMVGIYSYRRYQVRTDLADVLAALDRTEPGWRLEGLEQSRPVLPADDDSAVLILKLHSRLPPKWLMEDPETHWRDLWPNDPLPPDEAALFEPRMAQIEPLLPEVRRLAERPRGRFVLAHMPNPIATLYPHVQKVRELADVLQQDACWQDCHGDLDGALLSCRAGINVAHSLDGEPSFISQLVRAACQRMTLTGLQRTLASGEPPAPSLPALQQALADSDQLDSAAVGLRGERAEMHRLCTNLTNGTVPPSFVVAISGTPGNFFIANKAMEMNVMASVPASHVWMLQHFNAALDACRLPAKDQTARMNALKTASIDAPPLAKMLACAWVRCHMTLRRDRAHVRCAVVAVAIERYRLQHGQWPADLDALKPAYLAEIPADPYTDEPLQYKKTANGVVVYSVGPDGSHKGDYYDHPQPRDPAVVPVPAQDAEFEFRLWNPEARKR